MNPDPPIDEIRAVRHRISESCGHDPKRLVERYIEIQRRYVQRLVPSPPASSGESQDGEEKRQIESNAR